MPQLLPVVGLERIMHDVSPPFVQQNQLIRLMLKRPISSKEIGRLNIKRGSAVRGTTSKTMNSVSESFNLTVLLITF